MDNGETLSLLVPDGDNDAVDNYCGASFSHVIGNVTVARIDQVRVGDFVRPDQGVMGPLIRAAVLDSTKAEPCRHQFGIA